MGEVLITRRGGLGGVTNNVFVVYVARSGATVTVTKGTLTSSNPTDSAGYAYFTNLEDGTWTVTASKSGLTDCSKTITISSSQSSYYMELFFERYLYNGSYGEAGSSGANVCSAYSHGWGGNNINFASSNVNANYTNTGGHFYNGTTASGTQAKILSEAIDLANYNTLHIKSKASRIDTSKTWYIRYPNTASGGTYYKWIGTALASASLTSTNTETLTIDISHLSQRKVIVNFEIAYNTITLYKMWLD